MSWSRTKPGAAGDATLDQVAGAVGFSATSALVRAFKRWTGESPSAHRARTGSRSRTT
jgi:AraC-like DNA-binding protein